MKTKANKLGRIEELLPNLQYRVHIEGEPEGTTLRCIISGKMKLAKIHIMLFDIVEIVHTPEMGDIGRIVWKR